MLNPLCAGRLMCSVRCRMRNSVTPIWMLPVVVCLGACGCSGAQGLVGLWQTDTARMMPPGHTNVVEAYETAEFLKDGSFKQSTVFSTDGKKKQVLVFFYGTYSLIDTNHVRLELTPISVRPSDKVSVTVQFNIAGNKMEMDKLIPSAVVETQKYRRVK